MSIVKAIRVGIMPLERVRDYTLAIANGTYKRKPTEPRIWFTSIKSFAAVLSDENREMLRIIHDNQPESIADLEQMTGRKASNLSRTLRTMANYGLVRLEDGSQGRGRRAVKPVAVAAPARAPPPPARIQPPPGSVPSFRTVPANPPFRHCGLRATHQALAVRRRLPPD